MMSETVPALNLGELEERARAVLPPMAYGYYASGANDEVTLRENRSAYERIALLGDREIPGDHGATPLRRTEPGIPTPEYLLPFIA